MAKTKTKTVTRKKNITKKPGFRLGMIGSAFMIVLAFIFLFLWFSYRSLFNQNAHFIIKRVIVRSGGWWNKKSKKVENLLAIKPGLTNIFAVDLALKRKQLAEEPSIESVAIARVLPDTLLFDINERIPIAFLHRRESSRPAYPVKVIDEHGMVMLEGSCINVDKQLPVITGIRAARAESEPGKELKQVLPAIQLIELASKIIPNMMIFRISLSDPKYFNTSVYIPAYKKRYILYLSRKDLENKLYALKALLKEIQKTRPDATVIDMRFEGSAVVK